MTILEYAKVMEHQCSDIEELLLCVQNECEVRGLSAKETIDAAKEVKAWYTAMKDYKAGMRDCKGRIYDKWYRYNRADDGAAYDDGWMHQNKTTQCEVVTFLNA